MNIPRVIVVNTITFHRTFHELIVDLRNLHLPFHILDTEYVPVFYLFDCLKLHCRNLFTIFNKSSTTLQVNPGCLN